ncbi:MAG: GvpL/GvpF family gas vesicle protein [Terriglobales bacterium]
MAWYAYCIAEQPSFRNHARARRPFPLEGCRGVSAAQVLGYPTGEFVVIVSEYVRTGSLDQRAVLEHARVVSECFRHTTVLPFRFGTVFDTDDALRRAVRSNRKTFLETVAHLRGKSEMHLKLTLRDGSMPHATALPAAVGNEYLTCLRQQAVREREAQTKARAISVQVNKLFNPLEQEITCKKVDSGGLLIDIAHLIESKAVPKYQNRFSTAMRHLKDCEVVISGPWPPYHFMPGKLRTVTS